MDASLPALMRSSMCRALADDTTPYLFYVPVTQFEIGLVTSDDRQHAAKKRVDGAVALCGAGRIVQLVPGRFDSDDPAACEGCVSAAAAASG